MCDNNLHLIDKVDYVKLFTTVLQKEAAGSNHSWKGCGRRNSQSSSPFSAM